ncbi:putative baseplate assembly protein [Leifsonia poae]|uniref:Baseplate assembly protein n=1 Tax=Leifsonia poae TaxID=110933 RepID=A0A9W6HAZ6_9MICO|nr:putative baseplate assembly protein [Leifsonia poae]GLJ77209.1 putative baseplate assembly protein [Leifsonia poae]
MSDCWDCGDGGTGRWNGVDDVEVYDGGTRLCVHFIGEVPALADAEQPDGLTPQEVQISGGVRIRDIRVLRLETPTPEEGEEPCLEVFVDRCGDFSEYELCLRKRRPVAERDDGATEWGPYPGFDPRYGCGRFGFRLDCEPDVDCATCGCGSGCPCQRAGGCDGSCGCSAAVVEVGAPPVDYLAKDYESFRRLMFDRLAQTLPEWTERHEADLGVVMVELMAYAADDLSYYEDAVATEAYLGTARRRVSVKRHARLVGYDLHEGVNARTWVSVETADDVGPLDAAELAFVTAVPGLRLQPGAVLGADDLRAQPTASYEQFEIVAGALASGPTVRFRGANSSIEIFTWEGKECSLPVGATRATLVDSTPPDGIGLAPGDVVIFEEIVSPLTGAPADADPRHRHAVRLTRVRRPYDDQALVEVEWAREDALPFVLCLTAELPAPDCRRITGLSVVRGNVLPVDHGRTTDDPPWDPIGITETVADCGCVGSIPEVIDVAEAISPALAGSPLTFSSGAGVGPASGFAAQDPRGALPAVAVTLRPPDGSPDAPTLWTPRRHLLDSDDSDRGFVVEIDDDGVARLRFGDGILGAKPAAGWRGSARYRLGNGPGGNVGAESIRHLVMLSGSLTGTALTVRNPLPGTGGVAPEPVEEARLLAPYAFRAERRRAVTAADYAELAGRHPGVQRAAAELSWTGSWYEARVGIDPAGTETADPSLLSEIAAYLERYRRMGHDLAVVPARSVPLDIELSVCVEPHHLRGDVRERLIEVFGPHGSFDPDRLTFGMPVRVSRLLSDAQAIPGVESVVVTRLQRLFEPPAGEIDAGLLPIGPMEIARLDADPSLPENGRIAFTIGGGR